MARQQVQTSLSTAVTTTIAVPKALSSTDLWVTSYEVQALDTNTDFVYIGPAAQQLRALPPGTAWEIAGDNIDNGNSGKINLKDVYLRVLVDGEGVVVSYIEAT